MSKSPLSPEEKQEFQKYILESPYCIQELVERLGEEGKKLDFTPGSLKFVDTLLAKSIRKKEKIPVGWADLGKSEIPLNPEESWLIVRIAYYFAEVLIKQLEASWNIEKSPRHAYFKRPIIKSEGLLNGIDPLGLVLGVGRHESAKGLYEVFMFAKKEKETKNIQKKG